MASSNYFAIEDKVLSSLKRRGGEVTVGDVAADTGLALGDAEGALRQMLSVYKSHLDVDDEGNLLYRFDPALVRRGDEPGRLWYRFKKSAIRVGTWLFKVWIMIMLVGYTLAYFLILLALSIAAIAALFSSEDSDADGDIFFLPFYLILRSLEFLFWIDLMRSTDDYGHRRRRSRLRRKFKRTHKPFYQKVFDYVFGPDAEKRRDPLAAQAAFANFVRQQKGRVTAADWAARTGLSLEQADNALTAAVVRFQGDVDVTDSGTLVYRFDELRVTSEGSDHSSSASQGWRRELSFIWDRRANVASFTGNPSSTNGWITFFNIFNLGMASAAAVFLPTVAPQWVWPLAYVPLAFSLIFFAVPGFRRIQYAKKKAQAKRENERRRVLKRVFESAQKPAGSASQSENSTALDTTFQATVAEAWDAYEMGMVDASAIPKPLVNEVLAQYEGDIQIAESGQTYYIFPEVSEQLQSGRRARQQAAEEQVVFGQTVYSSDEERHDLAQEELDDFDRRLAEELGVDVSELETATVEQPAFA